MIYVRRIKKGKIRVEISETDSIAEISTITEKNRITGKTGMAEKDSTEEKVEMDWCRLHQRYYGRGNADAERIVYPVVYWTAFDEYDRYGQYADAWALCGWCSRGSRCGKPGDRIFVHVLCGIQRRRIGRHQPQTGGGRWKKGVGCSVYLHRVRRCNQPDLRNDTGIFCRCSHASDAVRNIGVWDGGGIFSHLYRLFRTAGHYFCYLRGTAQLWKTETCSDGIFVYEYRECSVKLRCDFPAGENCAGGRGRYRNGKRGKPWDGAFTWRLVSVPLRTASWFCIEKFKDIILRGWNLKDRTAGRDQFPVVFLFTDRVNIDLSSAWNSGAHRKDLCFIHRVLCLCDRNVTRAFHRDPDGMDDGCKGVWKGIPAEPAGVKNRGQLKYRAFGSDLSLP